MTVKAKEPAKIDRAAFVETERTPATLADVEAAMQQVMEHPAKPERQSENREPTKAELEQRWKLTRQPVSPPVDSYAEKR